MGALDGLTILRYGHAYDTRGGMEQYLSDLNGVLSQRSNFTTIQVQMTSNRERVGTARRRIGQGEQVDISLYVERESHERAIEDKIRSESFSKKCESWIRQHLLFSGLVYQHMTRALLKRRRVPRRAGEPDDAGATVRRAHRGQNIDLICLHTAGGADVSEILDVAAEERIPVVYIHHFSNDRLCGFSLGSQLERVQAVAGVCAVDAPSYLGDRFANVSDGIDTDFFRREKARPLERDFKGPVIFLPARLTPAKGQADVIRAAGELMRRGLSCHVALAGRSESDSFTEFLKRLAKEEGVADRVEFLGPLGAEELRDWYAAAAVLGFPTYHHEGLGRISVEAQAMGTPPVVYRIGGTPEGLEDGRTGLLVKLGDQRAFCLALEKLIRSEELRAKMGERGRQLAETKFGLTSLAERHERFMLEALKRAERTRN